MLVFSENLTRKGGRDTPNISQEKKKSAKPLRRELELYRENGVSIYLNVGHRIFRVTCLGEELLRSVSGEASCNRTSVSVDPGAGELDDIREDRKSVV